MVDRYEHEEILLVSNSSEELSEVKYLLEVEFDHLTTALGEQKGIEKFATLQPAVLVLAFREIGQSEEFYLMLHKRYPQTGEQLHQTLLLCTSRESHKAYQLCEEGVFDDYIVDRPLHDPQKIPLSIEQMLSKRKVERELSMLHREGKGIERGISEFDLAHKHQLDENARQHHELMEQYGVMDELLQVYLQQHGNEPLERASTDARKRIERVVHTVDEIQVAFEQNLMALQHKPGRTSILLVDDDEFYREQIADLLEQAGYLMLEADNGMSAINLLNVRKPSLILLDYKMPGMDGLATLRQIRQNPHLRDIPVIMLTGYSNTVIVKESLKAGVAGYIIKPGSRDQLLSAISKALTGKGALTHGKR